MLSANCTTPAPCAIPNSSTSVAVIGSGGTRSPIPMDQRKA